MPDAHHPTPPEGAVTGDAAALLRPADPGAAEGWLRLSRLAVPEQIAILRRAAQAFAQHAGADEPGDVGLACSEALTNVVLHAYPAGEPGPMHLEAGIDGADLVVVVSDEGGGLRPRPDSPGLGLGLPTMAQVCKHIDISDGDGGVRIRMTFPLSYTPVR